MDNLERRVEASGFGGLALRIRVERSVDSINSILSSSSETGARSNWFVHSLRALARLQP